MKTYIYKPNDIWHCCEPTINKLIHAIVTCRISFIYSKVLSCTVPSVSSLLSLFSTSPLPPQSSPLLLPLLFCLSVFYFESPTFYSFTSIKSLSLSSPSPSSLPFTSPYSNSSFSPSSPFIFPSLSIFISTSSSPFTSPPPFSQSSSPFPATTTFPSSYYSPPSPASFSSSSPRFFLRLSYPFYNFPPFTICHGEGTAGFLPPALRLAYRSIITLGVCTGAEPW